MAQLSESRMNVAALRRVDPYVKDIVETAAHVALYNFNAQDNEWEKTEVEGALFVYSRSGEPFHNFVIMNRLNMKNFVEPVTQGLDLHIQVPFLLFRTANGNIYCIWFYDKTECTRIATALKKLVKEIVQNSERINAKKQSQPIDIAVASNSSAGAGGNVDIFSMLTKAQLEYNSKMPQQPNSQDSKDETNSTPKSVMEFFAKASTGSQFNKTEPNNSLPSNILVGPRPLPPPGLTHLHQVPLPQQNDVKMIQRLMSNPAHSVEHIEKQQRSLSPQSELAALMKSTPNLNVNKDNGVSGGIKQKTPEQKQSILNQGSRSSLQTKLDNGMGFLRINDSASPVQSTTVLSRNFFNTNLNINKSPVINSDIPIEQRSLSAPHGTILNAAGGKPALMPPGMFISSTVGKETQPATNSNASMLLVNNNTAAPATSGKNKTTQLDPMTMHQFQQAFSFLLENDAEFVRKLHSAYIQVVSKTVT